MKKVSCIIPAYNEEKQIGVVLDAVLAAKQQMMMEVIVIDDGSTDKTPKILKKYKDIHVITNKQNIGKSRSIAKGFRAAKGDYILMLDADLIGLTAADISALLVPIQTGIAKVTMSVRQNSFPHMRMMMLDFITGERAFPSSLIASHIDEIEHLPNFGLEVFLNDLVIEQQYSVKTVYWKTVSHMLKGKKRGRYPAIKANTKMMIDMLKTTSLLGFFKQHIALIKLFAK